jgi:hypothetical protein
MSRTDALEAAARALQGHSDSMKQFLAPGSLGVPLPVGLAPAAMLAPLESSGWAQSLVSMHAISTFRKVRVGSGCTPHASKGPKKMHAVWPLPRALLRV